MKICDTHNDFLTEIKNNYDKLNYIKYIIKNKKIKKLACVIFTSKLKNPIEYINKMHQLLLVKKNKKLIFCIEDLGFINSDNYLTSIKEVINLKPFYCGIVWNNDNSLGGGAFGNKGLSPLGKIVIKQLEKNNIIIDTAHMNQKTFWDFSKVTTKPIFNSHCNFNYFNPHKRNISSAQIKHIVQSNGFISYSFVDYFISSKKVDCKKIAKQMAFFVRKYGDNNLGIGSDFYGTKKLPLDIKVYKDLKILKQALKEVGLKSKTINKIFYKNFINFSKRVND